MILAHSGTRLLSALTYNRFLAGDLTKAREYLDQGLAAQTQLGECISCDVLLYPSAVPVQLAVGQLAAAEVSCQRVEATAVAFRSRARTATARYLRGLLSSARGEWLTARGHLDVARFSFSQLDQPLDRARCLEALAEVARRDNTATSPLDPGALDQEARLIRAGMSRGQTSSADADQRP